MGLERTCRYPRQSHQTAAQPRIGQIERQNEICRRRASVFAFGAAYERHQSRTAFCACKPVLHLVENRGLRPIDDFVRHLFTAMCGRQCRKIESFAARA